jgi:exodeoxyribonuclease X
VVVDVEGNGQQPPDLVELAAVPITDGIIGEARSWLVRPDLPSTGFARKIHGISNELGEWECPEVFDTLKLARRLLPGHDSYQLSSLAGALSLTSDLPAQLTPRRATYDALVCARLFVRLAGVTHWQNCDPPPEPPAGWFN